MQDRLAELKKGKVEDFDEESQDDREEMGPFFESVQQVKGNLEQLKALMTSLEEKYSLALGQVTSDESTKTSKEVDELSSRITQLASQTKVKLENMKSQISKMESSDTDKRMKETLHGTLSRKFFELMKEFQEMQGRHRGKWREKVQRQIRIAAPEANDQEIDDIIESGDPNKIFANKILNSQDATVALNYVKDRHAEIQKLEKSILELHQLFVDMQVLVETQGELLDQIEFSVNQSQDYIKEASIVVADSYDIQKSNRKKICCIIILCIICLAIVAAAIAVPVSVVLKN